jgi:hypothetical protein
MDDGQGLSHSQIQGARRSPVFCKRFYSPFWESMLYSFNRRVLDDLERD